MRFALCIFVHTRSWVRVYCWIIHNESKVNHIAYLPSRDKWDSAENVVWLVGWDPLRVDISALMKLWKEELSA